MRIAAALIAFAAQVYAQPSASSELDRWKAFARIQTLNADILASRSATRTLESWCREHKLAPDPKLVAIRNVEEREISPDLVQREILQVSAETPVRYRKVRLTCGNLTLSIAELWYVPGRLSEEANRLLESTITPFGAAIQYLNPFRRTLSMTRHWEPESNKPIDSVNTLFEHEAVVLDSTNRPIALAREAYQRQILPPVK